MAGAIEPMDKLHHILAKQAAIQPEGVALWWHGEAITYAALNARVMAVAARLAGSGVPRERVAVLAWNCPQFIEWLYAVPASGKILVPLNARLAPIELRYQMLHAGITTLFTEPQFEPAIVENLIRGTSTRVQSLAPVGSDYASGPNAYFEMMQALGHNLSQCLLEQ